MVESFNFILLSLCFSLRNYGTWNLTICCYALYWYFSKDGDFVVKLLSLKEVMLQKLKLTQSFVELDTADSVLVTLEYPGTVSKLGYPCTACVVRTPSVHDLVNNLQKKRKFKVKI